MSITAWNTLLLVAFVALLWRVAARTGPHRYVFLSLTVAFYYAMCLQVDYLVFGIEGVESLNIGAWLSPLDPDYLRIVLLYLSYAVAFSEVSLWLVRRKGTLQPPPPLHMGHLAYNGLSSFVIAGFVVLTVSRYGLERDQIKAASGPVLALASQTLVYLSCMLLLAPKDHQYSDKLLLATFAIYSIVSFERENAIILLFLLFYLYCVGQKNGKYTIRYLRAAVIVGSAPILLFSYKAFVDYFVTRGLGSEGWTALYDRIEKFSFTAIDPAASLLLIREYFENDIYQDYRFSYLFNTLDQFVGAFGNDSTISLGRFATDYYTAGKMGTGFSMILEALMNFGMIGPAALGVILAVTLFKVSQKLRPMGLAADLVLTFVMIKLVRTELAVVLKLYVLPLVIASGVALYFMTPKVKRRRGHAVPMRAAAATPPGLPPVR